MEIVALKVAYFFNFDPLCIDMQRISGNITGSIPTIYLDTLHSRSCGITPLRSAEIHNIVDCFSRSSGVAAVNLPAGCQNSLAAERPPRYGNGIARYRARAIRIAAMNISSSRCADYPPRYHNRISRYISVTGSIRTVYVRISFAECTARNRQRIARDI